VIVVNPDELNTLSEIFIKLVLLVGNIILLKTEQLWNALEPILVTEFILAILDKDEQLWNALEPILVTESKVITLIKLVQPWNAL
jgi:hypothetical protein